MIPEAELFLVVVNAEETAMPALRSWHARHHGPDLVAAGFLSSSHFEPIRGEMRYLSIWEQTHDVLRTDKYKESRRNDAERLIKTESSLRYVEKSIFAQKLLGPGDPAAPFGSDWLTLLRFDVPAARDADIQAWLAADELPGLMRAGALRVRIAVRSGVHPLWPNDLSPRSLVIVESPTDIGVEGLEERLRDRFGADVTKSAVTVGRRWYHLRRIGEEI